MTQLHEKKIKVRIAFKYIKSYSEMNVNNILDFTFSNAFHRLKDTFALNTSFNNRRVLVEFFSITKVKPPVCIFH